MEIRHEVAIHAQTAPRGRWQGFRTFTPVSEAQLPDRIASAHQLVARFLTDRAYEGLRYRVVHRTITYSDWREVRHG